MRSNIKKIQPLIEMFHRPRVLFICLHNAARSQMCEALLKHYGGDRFDAQSAGLERGGLNPLAVEVMAEIGVCDAESAEKCPIFPGVTKRLHWPFYGTSKFTGTHERKLQKVREIRDEIAEKIQDGLASPPFEQPA
ncbi:MAG TPA: arsenate reductase ArsC [Candidatus Udaeobacter sp.]